MGLEVEAATMVRYMMLRAALLVLTILSAATVVFVIARVIPGDPVEVVMGEYADTLSNEEIESIRSVLGLDQPLYVQYWLYIKSTVAGEFGVSFRTRRPVGELIGAAIGPTAVLTLSGVLISIVIGIPLGVAAAVHRKTWVDYVSSIGSLFFLSVPSFLVAIVGIYVLAYKLQWFPIYGAGIGEGAMVTLHHLVLPALVIGLRQVGVVTRMTRSCMLEVLGYDHVRTARAKGLSERRVIYGHGLRNASIALVTVVGTSMAFLVGSSVIIESVFARPGLGKLAVEAITSRDYPTIQGVVIVFAGFVACINLLVDMSYARLDPRIRY